MSTTWEHLAAEKRGCIDKSIPSEWKISQPAQASVMDVPANSGILSAEELKITESTATELVNKLAKGKLRAVDVTLAFCKRAALAHQLVSFLRPGVAGFVLTLNERSIVLWSSSLKQPWRKPRNWMSISRSTRSQLDRFTDCQFL